MTDALKLREWEIGGNCRVAYDGDLRRNVKRGYGINLAGCNSIFSKSGDLTMLAFPF